MTPSPMGHAICRCRERGEGLPEEAKGYERVVACVGCGEEFVVSNPRGRPRKWCSERCRRRTLYSGQCVDCGVVTDGSDGPGRASKRCAKCQLERLVEQRARDAARRNAEIERLWAAGLTTRQISDRLGLGWRPSTSAIAALRRRGFDLPHRRPAEQIARITAGSGERMAKARAARGT